MKNPLHIYSHFVANHTLIMLAIVVVITIIMTIGSGMVGTKYMEERDIIPENLPVIQAYDLFANSFGSDTTLMIVIELDPEHIGSDEVRDVRDPRVIKYLNILTEAVETSKQVESAASAASLLKSFNNGVLPQSQREIIELSTNPLMDQYIGSKYEMTVLRMRLIDVENTDETTQIVNDVQDVIDQIEAPPGLSVNVGGELAVGPIVTDLVGPDIQRILSVSFALIIIISFLVFFSFRYGIPPLAVIFIGIVWATGYIGFLGIDLSAQTSGTISMIIGIGIDFGIQITNRFREEIAKLAPEAAMELTMNNVFVPMFTTTLAALIGFRAMSWGQLTFFGEFADIMTYGVTACFLVAITLVPVVLVQGEKIWAKIKRTPQARKASMLIKRNKEVKK